ncbi:phosphonate metabolism protein/1,5-bisphosphokinase (PRPP-forming) PhnN [Microbaculum marinum]|uniref:Ribose 1,5-bisphosphate phosphokinase PhnN n=1 Tax=Microbaculum marinum TaxID=1764581 RepID=A0AAW9RWP5_9HYPH
MAGPGTLVLVVGPSGAGKDTAMRLAREIIGEAGSVRFVRRIVTRPADAGAEDHDSLDEAAFDGLVASGGAALHWRAHGLGYALPAAIDDWIADGATVVANVSRRIIDAAARRYAHVAVVHVTAPPDILKERLVARGREAGADIDERLAPVPVTVPGGVALHEIVNNGPPADAGRRLAEIIAGAGEQTPSPAAAAT